MRIRDPKWKEYGSGIRDGKNWDPGSGPQHCWWWKDPGPDPGGPKTYGSSGSTILVPSLFIIEWCVHIVSDSFSVVDGMGDADSRNLKFQVDQLLPCLQNVFLDSSKSSTTTTRYRNTCSVPDPGSIESFNLGSGSGIQINISDHITGG